MIGELPRPWTQPHERRNLRDYSCVLPPFYNLTSGPSGHQLWTHESPQLIDPVPRAFSDSVQIEKDPLKLAIFHESFYLLLCGGQRCLEVVGESAAHFRECGFIHGDKRNGV